MSWWEALIFAAGFAGGVGAYGLWEFVEGIFAKDEGDDE